MWPLILAGLALIYFALRDRAEAVVPSMPAWSDEPDYSGFSPWWSDDWGTVDQFEAPTADAGRDWTGATMEPSGAPPPSDYFDVWEGWGDIGPTEPDLWSEPDMPTDQGDYADIIAEAAAAYGVRPELIAAVIAVESAGNPAATNAASSARGLMQVTRAAAADVGADYNALFDPRANVLAGTAYLARMIGQFGERGGVEAYYQGPGNQRKGQASRILADATRYADKVFAYA